MYVHGVRFLSPYLSDQILHETINSEDHIGMHTKHLPTGVLVSVGVNVACGEGMEWNRRNGTEKVEWNGKMEEWKQVPVYTHLP